MIMFMNTGSLNRRSHGLNKYCRAQCLVVSSTWVVFGLHRPLLLAAVTKRDCTGLIQFFPVNPLYMFFSALQEHILKIGLKPIFTSVIYS